MTVEIKPTGVSCNLNCLYCYERSIRNNDPIPIDLEKIQTSLGIEKKFTLFGGEPLLAPIPTLERLLSLGNNTSIQTNGLLINDEIIELLKKHNTSVGVSIDGPGILNKARCNPLLTSRIQANIAKLLNSGIKPSLIITLTKYNVGSPQLLDTFIYWLFELDTIGITNIRIHILEIDNKKASDISLNTDELLGVLMRIHDIKFKGLSFDIFNDIKRALSGDLSNLTCHWNACDPYNTSAVRSIEPNGDVTNCGRLNKTSVSWLKSDGCGNERQQALWDTPQEFGGCKGCRFFMICKGHCPGTAIDGDWRNKTRDCEFWFKLLGYFETPESITRKDDILTQTERYLGGNYSLSSAHGDSPHGDSHGDHTDQSLIHVKVVK